MADLYEYLYLSIKSHLHQKIHYENSEITYAELLKRVDALSKSLTKNKYGILCDNPILEIISILACLKAKKTAVLLSEKYGQNHCDRIINKTKLSHLITDNGVVKIRNEAAETEDLSDVAFIMCTSGTTGVPKGAMITHENLITNLNDISTYFQIYEYDHFLISRPLYHCAVLTGEFLYALTKGARISFYNAGFNPIEIIKSISLNKVTVFCGTPSTLFHICKTAIRLKKPLPLKSVVVSGECMNEAAAKTIRQALPSAEIYNVYGLTEASPRVSYLPPEMFDSIPPSVGKLLPSLRMTLQGNELLISGKSVMKGYYNDKEMTDRVIKDGWLHTGDIAETDENGLINIKGRKDNMIIRAGMNIYPSEIENAMLEDNRIKEVLAFGEAHEKVGQKISLLVVSDSLTPAEVFNICKSKLSSFQMPDSIELVDKIDRNTSGKVIRRYE